MNCSLTTVITSLQCLSESRGVINTNFNNIGTLLCSISSTYTGLELLTSAGPSGSNVFGIPGLITAYAGNSIPTNWLLCDGSEVIKTNYPILYSVIGDTFGVATSSTLFKLPNIQSTDIEITPRGTTGTPGLTGSYTTTVSAPTATTIISAFSAVYFGGQVNWPAGYYRVQYVTGGFCRWNSFSFNGYIQYGCALNTSGINIAIGQTASNYLPGSDPNYNKRYTYAELISSGQNYFGPGRPWFRDFYHNGGPIYIWTNDIGGYSDNTLGNGLSGTSTDVGPTYSLHTVIPTMSFKYIISTTT